MRILLKGLVLLFLINYVACASIPQDNPVVNASSENSENIFNAQPKTVQAIVKPRPDSIQLGSLTPLLGDWQVQDYQLRKDGQWEKLKGAQWSFSAIQNGLSMSDRWVSNFSEGIERGYVNTLRVYNPSNTTWQSAWMSSRDQRIRTFFGQEYNQAVVFTENETFNNRLTRHIFSKIQQNSFEWHIEWSKDSGETWLPVYRVIATRL